jgi:ELWxxDGT repeat protein
MLSQHGSPRDGPRRALPAALLLAASLAASGTAAAQPGFLVKDIDPSHIPILWSFSTLPPQDLYGSQPSQLVELGGRLFFVADDRRHGAEIWRSDGTAAGTVPLRDICPGPCGAGPIFIGRTAAALYFWADDGAHGRELWRTDGTRPGTVLLRDICPGPCDGEGGGISFTSLPWLGDFRPTGAAVDERLLFPAFDPVHGRELWRSDGTAAGTILLRDICPGTCSGGPENLLAFGGAVLFSADAGGSGVELWRSNATRRGTVRVLDACPGAQSLAPRSLTPAGSQVFFTGRCGSGDEPVQQDLHLYRTDGSAAGTVRLATNLALGVEPQLTAVGTTVFFVAPSGETGTALWRSDGTVAGTALVESGFQWLGPLVALGKRLLFNASQVDAPDDFALWTSDGSAPGTFRLAEIFMIGPAAFGDRILFRAFDETGWELWQSRGTRATTVRLQDVYPGPGSSYPAPFVAAGDWIFFTADDPVHDRELWALPAAPL